MHRARGEQELQGQQRKEWPSWELCLQERARAWGCSCWGTSLASKLARRCTSATLPCTRGTVLKRDLRHQFLVREYEKAPVSNQKVVCVFLVFSFLFFGFGWTRVSGGGCSMHATRAERAARRPPSPRGERRWGGSRRHQGSPRTPAPSSPRPLGSPCGPRGRPAGRSGS